VAADRLNRENGNDALVDRNEREKVDPVICRITDPRMSTLSKDLNRSSKIDNKNKSIRLAPIPRSLD
jgi:hypothetical protein